MTFLTSGETSVVYSKQVDPSEMLRAPESKVSKPRESKGVKRKSPTDDDNVVEPSAVTSNQPSRTHKKGKVGLY